MASRDWDADRKSHSDYAIANCCKKKRKGGT